MKDYEQGKSPPDKVAAVADVLRKSTTLRLSEDGTLLFSFQNLAINNSADILSRIVLQECLVVLHVLEVSVVVWDCIET